MNGFFLSDTQIYSVVTYGSDSSSFLEDLEPILISISANNLAMISLENNKPKNSLCTVNACMLSLYRRDEYNISSLLGSKS